MGLTISRVLHAGYVFACGATTVAFDPIFENPFSRNCHAYPDVRFEPAQIRALAFDAVFISHLHDDHCSLESLDLLARSTPIYLYCVFDELFALVRALGFEDVRALHTDAAVQVGSIRVIPRAALDADVDAMFQVQADGLNVLNVVDAWIDPDALPVLAQYAPWDMVLWPFQTMREIDVLAPSRASAVPAHLPEDWFEQLAVLQPRYVVPSSCQFVQEPWSWYNHALFPVTYRQFQHEVEAALPGARVVRMNPSVSLVLSADSLLPAAPLPWVIPLGPQDLDYAFEPGCAAPPTATIAARFAPLDAARRAHVIAYCRNGLAAKYRSMELPEESFFARERFWQLTIYDADGSASVFRYRIEGDAIEALADQGQEPLSWTTEIAAAKLYAALELGESLTSLYLRINDARFDPATEAAIAEADLTDDPLIRCLFNDVVGAYQAAQLRRLAGRA